MCIIVEKREQDTLSRKQIENFYRRNTDGWGIMYQPGKGLAPVTLRGYGNDHLWKTIREMQDRELYLHCRMATHGTVSDDNIHPFHVLGDLYLMHNGIFDVTPDDVKASDTAFFVRRMLAPMLAQIKHREEYIRGESFGLLIEAFCGHSNRLVLMDSAGPITFTSANWHTLASGMRVSNTYAWDAPSTKTTNYWKQANFQYDHDYTDVKFPTYESPRDYPKPQSVWAKSWPSNKADEVDLWDESLEWHEHNDMEDRIAAMTALDRGALIRAFRSNPSEAVDAFEHMLEQY